jgi:hypothetical protein
MADEVQATQPAVGAAAPEGAAAAKKTKKVNRLNAKDISTKIEALENSHATGSKYYKHLLQRKQEIGG